MNKIIAKYKQSDLKHEIKDVFYLIALQGVNYIAPLVVLPYLMVALGAEKFGYIGFSLSVTQYLMLIVDFGFNLSATKRIAIFKDDKEELNKTFSATLYAKIGLLLVSFITLLLVSIVPQFNIYREILLVMFIMVFGNTFTFIFLFQGLGQIRNFSILNALSKFLILPLTFIFVKNSNDYLIAGFLQAFVFILTMIISILFIAKNKWVRIMKFSKKRVLAEMKEGFPIFVSNSATSLYMASFVVVLGYFSTPEQVGQYSAVERIVRAVCFLLTIPIIQAFYPKISQIGISNLTLAMSYVKKIIYFILILMTILSVGLFFFSSFIIEFLGEDYTNTDIIFKIMALIPIFSGLSLTVSQLVILALGDSNDKKNYQRVCIRAGVIAIVFILAIIPFFYIVGASACIVLIEIFLCISMLYYAKKFFNVKTYKNE